jgi:hypothetical protein
MATIYSSDLKLSIMATGENAGTWGQITNTNLYLLQQAIGGYEAISIAGGAQTTALTMSNGAISNARNAVIKLTGTITGNQVVTIPTGIEKTYIVSNGTTGAFTVEFKQAGGTGITFSTIDKSTRILFADGTNIVDTGTVSTSGVQTLTNKTLTSPIINEIDDVNSNEQVIFTSTASAVNEFTITNAATANAPEISATGSDTNIDLKITPKGSGKINLDGIKFPNADGSSGQFLKTDGSGSLSFADSGLAWQSVVTTSTITVVAGRAYFINTTSAACTVTLPSGTPTAGQQIQLVDYAGTFDTNALTINPNGNKIEGVTGNLQLTGDREGVILTYIDATQGWLATSGINEGTDALTPAPYSIDFLVVAGGGGGGSGSVGVTTGGGGGAGGYRTSTQGPIAAGVVITVTVGDGGAGGSGDAVRGNQGSDSSISGSGLSTITSTGGGYGGGNYEGPFGTGGTGGSGGGGTYYNPGGAGNTPSTSPSQGNNGGAGSTSPNLKGAGGGAGEAGNTDGVGYGGDGTASSITGSSVTYAGGGGGGNASPNGTGGDGGGGTGAISGAGSGTANTGGGGGGAGTGGNNGGSGGKGVVILSMPDANYSGTTTGSPTVATGVSGKTVLTFTGSGSYTT